MGRLTAIVLGSAAGGAFPHWNCRCPVCTLAWAGDARVRVRTQAGLAVSAGDGRWTLINARPIWVRGLDCQHFGKPNEAPPFFGYLYFQNRVIICNR
jgi:phosphoribosyl 1,2-cyclic phosphodiesterase